MYLIFLFSSSGGVDNVGDHGVYGVGAIGVDPCFERITSSKDKLIPVNDFEGSLGGYGHIIEKVGG
jgi:hypothetical protein